MSFELQNSKVEVPCIQNWLYLEAEYHTNMSP